MDRLTIRRTLETVAIFITFIGVAGGALWIARNYQQAGLINLFTEARNSPKESIATSSTVMKRDGHIETFFSVDPKLFYESLTKNNQEFMSEWVVASFDSENCGHDNVKFTLRWMTQNQGVGDFTKDSEIRGLASKGRVDYYFPVFGGPVSNSYFAGVGIPEEMTGCLTSLSRVVDKSIFPMTHELEMFDGWEKTPLYFTLEKPFEYCDGAEAWKEYYWRQRKGYFGRLFIPSVVRKVLLTPN